jgi:hypothetical protein
MCFVDYKEYIMTKLENYNLIIRLFMIISMFYISIGTFQTKSDTKKSYNVSMQDPN